MQTIDEAREHCRFVGKDIEKMVAEDEDLTAKFVGTQLIRFKVDKDGDGVKVVGVEIGSDDSGIFTTESGVTKRHGDEIVGYAFASEPRVALVEFFNTLYYT